MTHSDILTIFPDFIQFFNYFLNQLNELKFNKIVEINLTKFKQTNKSQPPTSALETTWLKSRRALSTFSRVYRMFVDVRRERNVPHGTRSTPAPDTEEPGGTRTCRLCFHFNFWLPGENHRVQVAASPTPAEWRRWGAVSFSQTVALGVGRAAKYSTARWVTSIRWRFSGQLIRPDVFRRLTGGHNSIRRIRFLRVLRCSSSLHPIRHSNNNRNVHAPSARVSVSDGAKVQGRPSVTFDRWLTYCCWLICRNNTQKREKVSCFPFRSVPRGWLSLVTDRQGTTET